MAACSPATAASPHSLWAFRYTRFINRGSISYSNLNLAGLIRSLYCFLMASLRAAPFKNLRGLLACRELKFTILSNSDTFAFQP
jgi:hypothetical protein